MIEIKFKHCSLITFEIVFITVYIYNTCLFLFKIYIGYVFHVKLQIANKIECKMQNANKTHRMYVYK